MGDFKVKFSLPAAQPKPAPRAPCKEPKKRSKPPVAKKKASSEPQHMKPDNLHLQMRLKHWERRWVLQGNVFDHLPDIWLKKWVAIDDIAEDLQLDDDKSCKVFRCKIEDCSKSFNDAGSLKKHLVTHGEKQFVCTYDGCGKRFLDNSKLRRHQLVHTGERPYECQYCNKRFSLDFNLRTHLRTHTGEKPYQCSYPGCLKRFTQSSNLAAHEKTHQLKSKKDEEDKSTIK